MLTCQSTVVDCCWLPKLNCDVSVNNSKWSSYWNHWKAWFHIPLQMTWLTDWKVCLLPVWYVCMCVCMCFLMYVWNQYFLLLQHSCLVLHIVLSIHTGITLQFWRSLS